MLHTRGAYLTFKDTTLYPEPVQYRPEPFFDTKVDPYAFAAFGGCCVARDDVGQVATGFPRRRS